MRRKIMPWRRRAAGMSFQRTSSEADRVRGVHNIRMAFAVRTCPRIRQGPETAPTLALFRSYIAARCFAAVARPAGGLAKPARDPKAAVGCRPVSSRAGCRRKSTRRDAASRNCARNPAAAAGGHLLSVPVFDLPYPRAKEAGMSLVYYSCLPEHTSLSGPAS